ncbi:selenium metabolism-associated LysR family transcriptional regulator [Diplocloster agilis]|uniref:selenium metabolism-associated LysR family transcriptional regulator n=1 Tax=Diplocloster agilis TaxID=2850323 RepID=UPI0008230FAF|nr:selenium metabolism-associated LysR family transcriptional regulator [Suonthocola fibrivorans]MCU6733999.1 selenium metabolism-associated LysR family transcriptional regulator [Suonthocola fibrivorans]SCJ18877.1 HTH-type transcriptional activator CmpR [uncultured Clostridium sp.]
MNLKQLEAFVCVVEQKSFSKAAKALYLTQPTVSAHIQSLEKELGCRLLARSTKELFVTAKGERLYLYARQMLGLEEKILKEFHLKGRRRNERLALAASTIPGQYILPEILSAYRKQYPDEKFQVIQSDSQGVVEKIISHDAELGFTGTRLPESRCVFTPFYTDKLVVITPPAEEYRTYQQNGFPAQKLKEVPFLIRESGSGTRRETEEFLQRFGIHISELNIAAHMDHPEMIKRSVSKGLGVAIISEKAVRDYTEEGKILQFDLQEGVIHRDLYLVWEKEIELSAAAAALADYVSMTYGKDRI